MQKPSEPEIRPPQSQQIGGPIVNFSLPDIASSTKAPSLFDQMAGKQGAVVVFWSGVCSHCVRYDPYLNAFASHHPGLALVVVGSRVGETAEQIRATMAERKIVFPILHDPDSAVARSWSALQTPRAFLVDPNHNLQYRGAIDNYTYPQDPAHIPYLENAIGQFLAGKKIERTETSSFGCAVQSVYYKLPKNL